MRTAKVIKKHSSEFVTPLVMKTDEILEGEKRETEWEGWIYCRNTAGIFGWVPEPFLKKLPEAKEYVALRDYNAFELPVEVGQDLVILEEVSSWAWVRTTDYQEGWVPLENLDEASE